MSDQIESRLIAAAVLIVEFVLIACAAFFWIREEKQEISWEFD